MKLLRSIHLYLGCAFAPLLIFFAISGIWQRFGAQWSRTDSPGAIQKAVTLLSTLHTGGDLKSGKSLSSPVMNAFVVAMAASLILTIVLGVLLAFRFGHRKVALLCLLGGIVIPIIACILTARV